MPMATTPKPAIHGKDGQMHHQHAVCDICALRLTMENVPPDIAAIGYVPASLTSKPARN